MADMQGLLVVSGELTEKKYYTLYEMLIKAFSDLSIDLKLIQNHSCINTVGRFSINTDFVLFWDKDIKLCKSIENLGIKVFNNSRAIEVCDDKALTAIALSNSGIKMPSQIIPPNRFFESLSDDYLEKVVEVLKFPMIVKACKGSFGEQVKLVKNFTELRAATDSFGKADIIFQEFISSSFGRDVRVQVVGGTVVASVLRKAKDGIFCTNASLGGSMHEYTAPKEFIDMALSACRVLDLDFGGVDLLFGENGEPILLEVNSNAHFKNLFNATGVNTAQHIARYIKGKILL